MVVKTGFCVIFVESSDLACGNEHIMEKKILQIMSNVRLPLMTQAQLSSLTDDPFLNKYAQFFMPKLSAACAYHSSHRTSSPTTAQSESQSNVHCATESSAKYHVAPCSQQFAKGIDTAATSSRLKAVTQSAAAKGNRESWSSHNFGPQNIFMCNVLYMQSSSERTLWNFEPSGRTVQSCSTYYTPRNYMCDDWSTSLTIENFPDFPPYASHTYFFSTPKGMSGGSQANLLHSGHDTCSRAGEDEGEDNSVFEWQVEMYPKGIRFPPAVMISIPQNHDIDEHCQDVVRVAVISKTHHCHPCHVDVSVLAVARGVEDGTEYVDALAHKSCIFDKERMIHNIDNIVPFHHLNCSKSKYLTSSNITGAKQCNFKVVVIIRPSLMGL